MTDKKVIPAWINRELDMRFCKLVTDGYISMNELLNTYRNMEIGHYGVSPEEYRQIKNMPANVDITEYEDLINILCRVICKIIIYNNAVDGTNAGEHKLVPPLYTLDDVTRLHGIYYNKVTQIVNEK